jgi:hypothetical protein
MNDCGVRFLPDGSAPTETMWSCICALAVLHEGDHECQCGARVTLRQAEWNTLSDIDRAFQMRDWETVRHLQDHPTSLNSEAADHG